MSSTRIATYKAVSMHILNTAQIAYLSLDAANENFHIAKRVRVSAFPSLPVDERKVDVQPIS